MSWSHLNVTVSHLVICMVAIIANALFNSHNKSTAAVKRERGGGDEGGGGVLILSQ